MDYNVIARFGSSRLEAFGSGALPLHYSFLGDGRSARYTSTAPSFACCNGRRGTDLRITGQIEQLDGRHDSRLRLWLRADGMGDISDDADPSLFAHFAGRLVRLSFTANDYAVQIGDTIEVFARLYPPPSRVLAGLPDYRLRARARGVVASGYVHSMNPINTSGAKLSWRVRSTVKDRCARTASTLQ